MGPGASRFGFRNLGSFLGRQIEERDLPGLTGLMLAQTVIVTDKPGVADKPSAGGCFTVAGAGIGALGTEQRNTTSSTSRLRARIQSTGRFAQDGKFPLMLVLYVRGPWLAPRVTARQTYQCTGRAFVLISSTESLSYA